MRSIVITLLLSSVLCAQAHAQSPAELITRGRRARTAGGVLIGIGAGIMAAGVVMSLVDVESHRETGPAWLAAEILALGGAPLVAAGVPPYIVGDYLMAKGQRLQLSGVAAAPLVGPGGVAGLAARASFRF
jgi:hypothetical protein